MKLLHKSGEHYFWQSLEIPTLTACRTIMLAGHETTAKAVRVLSPFHPLSMVLTDYPVDLYALGTSQAPRLPGETPCGDQRDPGEGQGER